MGSYAEHENLIKRFKLLAQQELKQARFFSRHVGLFHKRDGTPIQINKKGMADLYGIITVDNIALHIEIEAKTGNSQLSKEQRIWRTFCESRSIPWFLMRDEKETIQEIVDRLFTEKLS